MKVIKIQEGVFKTEVLVIWNCSIPEANKYLKKIRNPYFIEGDNTIIAGTLVKCSLGIYRILYIQKLDKKNLETLVHELFHLVIRICEDKGVPTIPNVPTGHCGDETGAYLYEFYFREVFKKL